MEPEPFRHPHRFPKNAEGAFYTVGELTRASNEPDAPLVWCAGCLVCGAPEAEAPELLAPLADDNIDTYFVRQPRTPDEVEHACRAIESCCVAALRYGGRERDVIERLANHPLYCDYLIAPDGEIKAARSADGELAPFAAQLERAWREQERRDELKRTRKWWQFWR